jgi:hypothetical protein
MVIEESMRLYPPAHTMAREPISADCILGHRIPAKKQPRNNQGRSSAISAFAPKADIAGRNRHVR